MKNLRFRRFSAQVDSINKQIDSKVRVHSRIFPVPHRSIPDLRGHDLDFVSIIHSHLIHGDWSKLISFAHGLNPFRIKRILLKIQKDPVLSLEFYDWAFIHNPNSQTLETHAIILHILAKFRRFRAAESIFRKTILSKISTLELFDALIHSYRLCDSSPNVFDSLFKTCAHLKKFRSATETFFFMRDYGFLPTVRSCNAFMSSLIDHGRHDIVQSFYREMRRCRISPNLYTLNMFLVALCSSGRLEKALDVFAKMELMGFSPSVPSFNTLITAYCKRGLMSSAMKLKNEMQTKGLDPNVITYNSIIYGFCKEGKLHEANKILSEMKVNGASPNTVTYNTLINGYGQIHNGDMGLRIYEEMILNGVKPDILTYNAVILGFCNEGKTKKASYLVKEMDRENVAPNASTFAALISGHCKRQNSERAFEIYSAMKKSGYHPNYETFKLMISTFCKNKDFDGALTMLREMLEAWINPDDNLLTELYEGLRSSGKTHLARRFLSEADVLRFNPETIVDVSNCSIQLKGAKL
ncbi:pentatricopeptide repeat-containing protein At4g26680, mitochondrial [Phalaenopsis equestris]|uniref:pentatricopeptide repeat-containing protein At4g26680, mitochondrial n=1 Tax=Phalaenopsis equestris TaxID=78828 RepID=UPI0009E3AA98|nr:pentatricopeptide repeat-containing protein At4g26680, mitochondrial [Phalaenopsis equestris]